MRPQQLHNKTLLSRSEHRAEGGGGGVGGAVPNHVE